MKNEIITFLKDETNDLVTKFNKAFNYLKKVEALPFSQLQSYNILGATRANVDNMIYDLKKYYNISDVDLLSKRKPIIFEISEEETISDEKPKDPEEQTEEEQVKTNLHESFPFLKEKDCPKEMYIVVGHLVASWKRYNEYHNKIQASADGTITLTEEEDLQLTKAASDEFENNSALYNELEYYKENGKVLGAHDLLKQMKWEEDMEAMSTDELVKFIKNTPPNLSKDRKKLEQAKSEDQKLKIEKRLEERQFKLELANKLVEKK